MESMKRKTLINDTKGEFELLEIRIKEILHRKILVIDITDSCIRVIGIEEKRVLREIVKLIELA